MVAGLFLLGDVMNTIFNDHLNVSVKLDGEYAPFRDVNVTINETATFPSKPLDIQLTLANGEVVHDGGSRVEVIVRT